MLTIKIKPSKGFISLISIFYFITIILLFQSFFTPIFKFLCILFCFIHFFWCLSKYYYFLLPHAITHLWHTKEGNWLTLTHNGNLHTAILLGNSYISSYIIILNFKLLDTKKKLSALLVRDVYDKEEFRHIKIALKNT